MHFILEIFRKPILRCLGLIIILVLLSTLRLTCKPKTSDLIAVSELGIFRGEAKLLDPFNLIGMPEVYLLENLSIGLVSEKLESAERWQSGLAERWEQLSPYEWVFFIRSDSRWSDGSPLTLQQIADHFEILGKGSSPQLPIIRSIDSITIDEAQRAIHFIFEKPLTQNFLHELSFAEAAILHPANLYDDWSVSSGAYFVASRGAKFVRLQANAHFMRNLDIQSVLIYPNAADIHFDVHVLPSFSFRKDVVELSKKADHIYNGHPMDLYYFYFPPGNDHNRDIQTRQAFRWLIHQAFDGFDADRVVAERQLVSEEFSERLQEEYVDGPVDLRTLQGQRLQIELNENVRSSFFKILDAESRKHGIEFNFVYTPKHLDTFARFDHFVVNQKNSLSSWRFLYGSSGPLSRFYPQVESLFDEVASANADRREQLLVELHRFTLDQVYVVPFLAEDFAILHSSRVDLSALSRFDLRLHFFDMKWK